MKKNKKGNELSNSMGRKQPAMSYYDKEDMDKIRQAAEKTKRSLSSFIAYAAIKEAEHTNDDLVDPQETA